MDGTRLLSLNVMHTQISNEWYRNETWDEEVAQRFREKLRRARRKERYLRIQACTLAPTHPEVALDLLSQYFELPDDFDHAQAHVDRATALLALDRIRGAIESYEAALKREDEFPQVLTQAYLDLPYLIATRGIRERFDQARALLDRHKARPTFPVEHFRWHAAQALLFIVRGDLSNGRIQAKLALEAAALDHSGFRYHPSVGLVTEKYDDLIQTLERCRDA